MNDVSDSKVMEVYKRLLKDAKAAGYNLNPDEAFAMELVRGLITNTERFGYMACPCRLASGIKDEDLDIICPCDYRDADLNDFGACYCALYVSEPVLLKEEPLGSIPERRPAPDKRKSAEDEISRTISKELPKPVWRCKVCGYLCARDQPPEVCPICKAKKDRFERFL